MKVAVTDACIFIDIIELKLASQFFNLPIELHTTIDVYNELYPEQQELLKAYQSGGKLFLYNISEDERKEILEEGFPRALSDNDKTVLFLAAKIDAFVLSSDKAVRNYARKKVIEYHGLLWIFDQLIAEKHLQPYEAAAKLKELMGKNIIYQYNNTLAAEIEKRLKQWMS
ncbi:PIN domain-containing protein [Pontibacter fetidus]|uniref:PIN domain-containing protein n=1 Tax=Pontibacter fetidus TaxID=2700082 RepID=A0A6B2HAK4_9BACT|nr:hypothetical protein [Pontibacter fetidus]NDK57370.1 hypothetical protein [Pontibacter fetidus]